jgi:hypothetical protein
MSDSLNKVHEAEALGAPARSSASDYRFRVCGCEFRAQVSATSALSAVQLRNLRNEPNSKPETANSNSKRRPIRLNPTFEMFLRNEAKLCRPPYRAQICIGGCRTQGVAGCALGLFVSSSLQDSWLVRCGKLRNEPIGVKRQATMNGGALPRRRYIVASHALTHLLPPCRNSVE